MVWWWWIRWCRGMEAFGVTITYSIIVTPLETNNTKGEYPNNAVAIQKDADHEDDRNSVVGLDIDAGVFLTVTARTT